MTQSRYSSSPDRMVRIYNGVSNRASAPLLETIGLSKHFGSRTALQNFDLRVYPGEIHAILGENGAGKSTLMNILYGVLPPSEGSIVWRGKELAIASPSDAKALGIGMVFQHFSLFETLSVAENLRLALTPIPPQQAFIERLDQLKKQYGLDLDADAPVVSLSAGQKQTIEIARCLLQKIDLLILDEPTSVLAPTEIESLMLILRTLAQQGCAILFISHKLREVQTLCDNASILRSGRKVHQCAIADTSSEQLAQYMFGADMNSIKSTPGIASERRLQLKQVCCEGLHKLDVEFSGGQIFGIAGIAGNGQDKLLSVFSGEIKPSSGSMVLNQVAIESLGVRQRRQLGISCLPVDRLQHAAVASLSLTDNTLLTDYDHYRGPLGWLKRLPLRDKTEALIERFNVVASGADSPAGSLSGGNLQKFLVGRALAATPRVFVCYNPTWGVDMGAAQSIHQHVLKLRDSGAIVIIISEDLDELLALSDTISAINSGQLCPPIPRAALDINQLSLWMTDGASAQEAEHAPS